MKHSHHEGWMEQKEMLVPELLLVLISDRLPIVLLCFCGEDLVLTLVIF